MELWRLKSYYCCYDRFEHCMHWVEVNIVAKIFCDRSIAQTLISTQILVHGVFSGKFLQIFSYVGYGCYILKGPEPTYWLTSWIWRVCDCIFWKISIQVVWYNLCVEDGSCITSPWSPKTLWILSAWRQFILLFVDDTKTVLFDLILIHVVRSSDLNLIHLVRTVL